ncbi:type VII secretion protein EccE [Streptomyces boninensis]|uniref:type VII secretion protein EccE n=1 Tax=Streptomyces boninensis TaxID=2039455 RepID=UPI003B2220E9
MNAVNTGVTAAPGRAGRGARGPVAAPRPASTPAPASTTLRVVSRGNRLGPLRLPQLVLIELALAVLVLAASVDELWLVPAAVVAIGLGLLALLRRRQRSILDWVSTVLAFRARRRVAAAPLTRPVDPRLAPVAESAPGVVSYAYVDKKRRTVGMVGDGSFLTAVVRVEAGADALRPAYGARALPLDALADALDVDGIVLESVQVVQHVQAAPASYLPEHSAARNSYGPLQAQAGSAPGLRVTWVALKLDPELCREAVKARGGGLEGAQKCLVRAADHVASRVTGAGFRATVLDEEELLNSLSASAGAHPEAAATPVRPGPQGQLPPRRTQERARAWLCDDRWHASYAVGRWPALGRGAAPLPRVVSQLTAIPTLTTTVSLTMGRTRHHRSVSIHGHLRVTALGERELSGARQLLERAARGAKVSLVRLDREQLMGVLATLPMGGTR